MYLLRAWKIAPVIFFITLLLAHTISREALANGSCPVALSTGQPACGNSVDTGSAAPDPDTIHHVGNPIDVVSGNKYQVDIDVRLPGSQLALTRHYNSAHVDLNIGFGNGWQHTYAVTLTTEGENTRRILQSDGRVVEFFKTDDALFHASDESDGYVVQQGDTKHTWHLPDGRRLHFYGSFLIEINMGDDVSVLKLHYKNSRLQTVTDEIGRVLEFEYWPGSIDLPAYDAENNDDAPGHISAVILPDGSRIRYRYSRNQNLLSAEYPRGGDWDRIKRYWYRDAGNKHLLTERGNGGGALISQWQYDDQGRVISYRSKNHIGPYWKARGASDITLSYSISQQQDSGITTVVDREGNRSEFHWELNSDGQVEKIDEHYFGVEIPEDASTESRRGESAANGKKSNVLHYNDDVVTIIAVDELGFPETVQYQFADNGSTHLLNTDYDLWGRLLDVRWTSGFMEGFNSGGELTLEALQTAISLLGEDDEERYNELFLAIIQLSVVSSEAARRLSLADQVLDPSTDWMRVGTELHGDALNKAWLEWEPKDRPNFSRRSKQGSTTGSNNVCSYTLQDCNEMRKARDFAEVSECAYVEKDCTTRFWEANLVDLGVELDDVHKRWFHSEIFYNKEADEYIVSFAGTKMTSPGDFYDSFSQEFNFYSFGYEKALALAKKLKDKNPGKNFVFTGHSLGGGLATAASAFIGEDATVFNPAGLDRKYAESNNISYLHAQKHTTIFSVEKELLASLQNATGGFMSNPPGYVNALKRPNYEWVKANVDTSKSVLYPALLSFELHGMSAVKQSINDLLVILKC